MKKILSIVIIVLGIILIGAGAYLSLTDTKEPEKLTPPTTEEQDEQKDPTYNDPNTDEKILPEITTTDNQITFKSTKVHYRDQVSQITIKMTSQTPFPELYIKIEFTLQNETESRIIRFMNVKVGEEQEYIIQSAKDLTKTSSWTISQTTKEAAQNEGVIFED